MRFAIITALAVFVAVGCSSKKKNEDMSKVQGAPAAAKAEADKAAKKMDSAKKEATSATKVECKLKGDTRILDVRGKDKGCEIAYTKAGQENVVGSSQYGTEHCEGIMNRIKDKLVAAGFACE